RRVHAAAIGWRTGILVDPERYGAEVLCGDLLADVLDSGDGLAWAVVDRLSAGIDAGEITRVRDCFGPREKIRGLICSETAALFLIEEDDGLVGKVFALSGSNRGGRILRSEYGRGGAGSLCLLYLGLELAVCQHKEAEVIAEESVAFAEPRVLVLAGRIG